MHRAYFALYIALVPVLLLLAGCGSSAPSTPTPQKIAEATRTTTIEPTSLPAATPYRGGLWDPRRPTPTTTAPSSGFERMSVRQVCVLVSANLRAGPGVNYRKVGSVQPGALLNIDGYSVASDEMWYHIVSDEWIRSDLVADKCPSPPPPPPPPPPTCKNIKGNVAYETGEKIYHLPNCPNYDATLINPKYGERWFCTEEEALAAGWRKAKNCP